MIDTIKELSHITFESISWLSPVSGYDTHGSLKPGYPQMRTFTKSGRKRVINKVLIKNRRKNLKYGLLEYSVTHYRFMNVATFRVTHYKLLVWSMFVSSFY